MLIVGGDVGEMGGSGGMELSGRGKGKGKGKEVDYLMGVV